jgi:hypothetical protein
MPGAKSQGTLWTACLSATSHFPFCTSQQQDFKEPHWLNCEADVCASSVMRSNLVARVAITRAKLADTVIRLTSSSETRLMSLRSARKTHGGKGQNMAREQRAKVTQDKALLRRRLSGNSNILTIISPRLVLLLLLPQCNRERLTSRSDEKELKPSRAFTVHLLPPQ